MSNVKENKELSIQVLLESYKIINEEAKTFLNEMIKCFIYSAALIGIYLGVDFGSANVAIKLKSYMPYTLERV